MLRRLSGVHMPDELRVEVRIGGKPVPLPAALRAVAVPDRRRGAVQHRGARARRAARWSGSAYRCDAVRLTISDDGGGRPEEVRRSLRAAAWPPRPGSTAGW